MGSGEDGSKGVLSHVEFSETVTPVVRETLDSFL